MAAASNMTQRVAFALVAIPVVAGAVWFGGAVLAILVAIAAVRGARELEEFARRKGMRPIRPVLVLAAAGLPVLAWASLTNPKVGDFLSGWWPFLGLVWFLVVLLATLWRIAPKDQPLGSAAVTMFAPLYAGGLPAFLLAIRHADYGERSLAGAALAFFPLVTVWVCDSVAMGAGKRLGGPRLAPRVSPGKTWSGAIGGWVGALAVAPLWAALVFRPLDIAVSPWRMLVVAGAIGSLGQLGDLVESLFKREVGVKDSSHLIPGHGGVLDRLDSLYFALPITAGLYRLFGVI